MLRRFATLSVAVALALSACSGGGAKPGTAGKAANDGLLTVIGWPLSPTFVENYNIGAPTTGPLLNMMYEPLVRVDDNHMEIKPYLAESWEWSADAKTLKMKLRKNATWSDGKDFTSADVKFSFDTLPKKYPDVPLSRPSFASVQTPDPDTVVFGFDKPSRALLHDWGWTTGLIVPEHIFGAQNLTTWTNPKPVTTGPFTLERFTPQQVTLKVRDEWWGGKSKGVKTVKILASGSAEAAQTTMLKGEADWANITWADPVKQWTTKPEHKFWKATSAYFAINPNMAVKPFDDVHVRRALYAAFDSAKLMQVLHDGSQVVNITGMDSRTFGENLAPEFRNKLQAQDIAAAKSELAAGGYTVSGGALVKEGKSYKLTLSGQEWDAATMRVVTAQWKEALGLDVAVRSLGTRYAEEAQKGAFDLFMWSGGGCSVFCNYNALNSKLTAPIGKPAMDDYGRVKDAELDGLLNKLAAATTDDEIRELGWQVQRRYVDQRFTLPLGASGASPTVNTTRWQFPNAGEGDYLPALGLAAEPALAIMNLTPTGK
ncbi:ABC transporter substrate-binding protein [Planotetraspora sp. GP83]|uniref:ABC transporter substrate-binding protein n=1 Tax=Planotetraspora sp. GP83 TaxID=3156264 RepID=UPI003513E93C